MSVQNKVNHINQLTAERDKLLAQLSQSMKYQDLFPDAVFPIKSSFKLSFSNIIHELRDKNEVLLSKMDYADSIKEGLTQVPLAELKNQWGKHPNGWRY